MVARLSSKNFKKLIFLAYFVSKHTSTCPSGMTRQLMKIPFSGAKKTQPPVQSAAHHTSMAGSSISKIRCPLPEVFPMQILIKMTS